MDKYLLGLLMESIEDMEALKDYYNTQYQSLSEYIKKGIDKYYYGICLDRFFLKLVTESEDILISEEEKKICNEVLESYEIIERENRKEVLYKIKPEFKHNSFEMNPHKARKEFNKLFQQPDILNESTLMMLLVKYENCISGIYRFLLSYYPQAYLSSKSITYSELIECESDLESIKQKFIEKEVEEFMRMPLSDWYKTFEIKHKAKFDFIAEEMKGFKEIYYRRNIVVHNQGIANDIYVSNAEKKDVSIGERLIVDKEYIDSAFEKTVKVLIGTLWGLRKLADDKADICDELFNYGYKCLSEEKWELGRFINSLLLTDKDQQAADIMCERVNHWIAIKNISGVEKIHDEVDALDVSAMDLQFRIAKHALLDDFVNVSILLDKGLDDCIHPDYVREWPLFIQYRESEYYQDFIKSHANVFETQGYESENETPNNDTLIAEMDNQLVNSQINGVTPDYDKKEVDASED